MIKINYNKMRNFCINNNYFTGGTNSQYEKLFEMLESASVHELAIVIYVCSPDTTISEIENKLLKI